MAQLSSAAYSLQDSSLFIGGGGDARAGALELQTASNIVFSDERGKSPIYGSGEQVTGYNRLKKTHSGAFTLKAEDYFALFRAVRAKTDPGSPNIVNGALVMDVLLDIEWKLWFDLAKRNPTTNIAVKSDVEIVYGVEFTATPEEWNENNGNEISTIPFVYSCRTHADDGVTEIAAANEYNKIFT